MHNTGNSLLDTV